MASLRQARSTPAQKPRDAWARVMERASTLREQNRRAVRSFEERQARAIKASSSLNSKAFLKIATVLEDARKKKPDKDKGADFDNAYAEALSDLARQEEAAKSSKQKELLRRAQKLLKLRRPHHTSLVNFQTEMLEWALVEKERAASARERLKH